MRREGVRIATWEEVCEFGGRLPHGLIAPAGGGSGVVLDHPLGTGSGVGAGSSLTCGFAVPAGDLIVAFGSRFGGSVTSQSLSDAGGNIYTAAESYTAAAPTAVVAAANVTTPLTTSSTVTYTIPGPGGGNGVAAASFGGLAANAAANPYAQSQAEGTSATISVTSGSVKAGDLAVLLMVAAGSAPATPTGWSVLETLAGTGGFLAAFYLVPGSTGTLTPSSAVTAGAWTAEIAAYPALTLGRISMTSQAVMRSASR